ncbi:ligand-gated channel [Aliidongia dinghuensis]|uniref:Ligand-gated channel n=1 Tax=Aliidongia dinghuensis TaxID=1867774 RepID=A0A8J2YY09_9PROT|nr:TonB-dependent receptor [Aliidongia dinghuensis]GGF39148.1 ligand-gated channel [Aliidongia dinghuensis]
MRSNWTLVAAGVKAGLCATAVVEAAWAADGQAAGNSTEEIIVTGTRAAGRTALTSSAPVDVIDAERLDETGYQDLGRALEFAEPSVNFPRAQTTPSSANTRPITLRGLSPDEVLVLVDGKRWHTSAVINTNFAVGRGSAPFDLSTIPISAIDHIEILRDGAAAQYGSDAIAGVINIILKSNDAGGFAESQAGITQAGDGKNIDGAFNQGFALGQGGHITVSGEAGYQENTNRAAVDQRFGRVTYSIGAPEQIDTNLAISAAYPLGGNASELYGNLLASRKDSTSAVTFGVPGTSPLYPNGFQPKVNPLLWDVGSTIGVRGPLAGTITYDLSNTFGYSSADFTVRDTANASLGLASPTTFDAGSATYLEDVTNFTANRPLPELLAGGNLAVGAEYRHEVYQLGRGAPQSFAGSGALGFPGFNPRIPVDNARDAGAGFIDLELKPLAWLTLGGAGRYDHYGDFGGAPTWKATARAEATDWLAFRASASTGFRAPSLQQEFYSSITTVANGANKSLVNVGTFQVGDPVARALGAEPLKPEKSRDYTAGVVVTPSTRFSITADLFRTDIDDRIALSDALSGQAVTAALAGAGIRNVQQVAYFTNALDTRTQGYDITARYAGDIDDETQYNLSLGYERSPTSIRGLAQNSVLPHLALIGVHARTLLTEAQPRDKLTGELTLDHGPYDGVLSVTRYGKYIDAPILDPQSFSAKTIVDLQGSVRVADRVTVTLGILNLGDVYPDKLQEVAIAYKSFGNSFVYGEESPWGTDGRAFFARVRVRL